MKSSFKSSIILYLLWLFFQYKNLHEDLKHVSVTNMQQKPKPKTEKIRKEEILTSIKAFCEHSVIIALHCLSHLKKTSVARFVFFNLTPTHVSFLLSADFAAVLQTLPRLVHFSKDLNISHRNFMFLCNIFFPLWLQAISGLFALFAVYFYFNLTSILCLAVSAHLSIGIFTCFLQVT